MRTRSADRAMACTRSAPSLALSARGGDRRMRAVAHYRDVHRVSRAFVEFLARQHVAGAGHAGEAAEGEPQVLRRVVLQDDRRLRRRCRRGRTGSASTTSSPDDCSESTRRSPRSGSSTAVWPPWNTIDSGSTASIVGDSSSVLSRGRRVGLRRTRRRSSPSATSARRRCRRDGRRRSLRLASPSAAHGSSAVLARLRREAELVERRRFRSPARGPRPSARSRRRRRGAAAPTRTRR